MTNERVSGQSVKQPDPKRDNLEAQLDRMTNMALRYEAKNTRLESQLEDEIYQHKLWRNTCAERDARIAELEAKIERVKACEIWDQSSGVPVVVRKDIDVALGDTEAQ